jgi:putative phage-type endonuclease
MNQLEQGSQDWLEWRRNGIGSSDAPIIMGISPWKTPFQLWEEKISPQGLDEKNWAQIRGTELEPIARANYELTHDIDMKPALVVHPKFEFLRASLDGYNEEASVVLEIKCPKALDHELALEGIVPEKYYPQLQHQLMVTRAELAHYYSFDGVKGALVEVQRNEEYIGKLLEKEFEFWECVKNKYAPPLTAKDYMVVEDPALLMQLELFKKKKKELQALEQTVTMIRRSIESQMPHPRMRGVGVRVAKLTRRGSVEYEKIPELENVDLNAYRKEDTSFITFILEKGKMDETS